MNQKNNTKKLATIGAVISALGIGGLYSLHNHSVQAAKNETQLEYQLKCDVNLMMDHKFHQRYPEDRYPRGPGSLYPNMETAFMSGKTTYLTLEKFAREGKELRNELNENLEYRLRTGQGPFYDYCR